MGEFVDHGALWSAPNGEDFSGKIFGVAVQVRPNPKKEYGDKKPAFNIVDPQSEGGNAGIGALWDKHHEARDVRWLSGHITIDGERREVSLWPAQRKSENSPRYRVMPPREKEPAPEYEPQPPEQATLDDDPDDSVPF